MDYQEPPQIVVTHTEHHDVKAEMVEYVARLLCRADGCNPESDLRCGPPDLNSNSVTCNAVGWPYPSYLGWNKYRPQAEKLLVQIFGEPPHGPCLPYPYAIDETPLAPGTLPIDPYMSRVPRKGDR